MVLSAERMYKSGLVKCGEHVLERALWTDALSWQCLSQDGASSPPARVNVWMPSDLPQRARFPEDSPELCVTFFTCVGTLLILSCIWQGALRYEYWMVEVYEKKLVKAFDEMRKDASAMP